MAETTHRNESITIQDAKILFRNLAGQERQYNSEGTRNFSVVLSPEEADEYKKRGWRVKQLKPQEDGTPGDYHLKVNVNYKTGRPPRVVLLTSQGRTDLGPDEVAMIDVADIEKADLVLNGWYSDLNGGGYSAYLKTMFVKIREDELELLYASVPAANAAPEPDDNWNE